MAISVSTLKAAGLTDAQIVVVFEKAEAERKERNRQRQADFQARKRANANNTANVINADNVIPVSEPDASHACSNTNLPTEDISYNPPISPPVEETTPRKASRAKPKTRIEADAQPTERDRQAAVGAGMSRDDFRLEWGKFRDHHVANGTLFADWAAGWRKWCANYQSGLFRSRAGPPQQRSILSRIATEDYFHEPSFDNPDQPSASGPNSSGRGFVDEVPERSRADGSGSVVDLRPTGSGWR